MQGIYMCLTCFLWKTKNCFIISTSCNLLTLAGDLFLEPIHERQLIHSQVTRISRSFSEPQCFEIKVRAKVNIALILCLTLDCTGLYFFRKKVSKLPIYSYSFRILCYVNHLSANPTNWSNTLKQFVDNLPTNCLSVFAHFVILALRALITLNYDLQWFV